MKVSRNPDLEEDEPEVRYIAAMHGDEVVGKELLIGLIHHLVDGYGVDARLTALVDLTEIWLLPSMNPDGTELAQRYNFNDFDLNRNFPDQFTDPVDSPASREPEVQAVMNWGYAHSPVLSGNFHGGALVVNYPYDGNPAGTDDYSHAPDDPLMVSLARSYAEASPAMRASNSDDSFFDGVCNGADWYTVRGGLQDWSYVWHGDIDMTLELGPSGRRRRRCPGSGPRTSSVLVAYLERAHEGVRGVVTDAVSGLPLAATAGSWRRAGPAMYGDPDVGDYHRMLLPGCYTLEVSAPGYVTARIEDAAVRPGAPAARRDVALRPLAVDLQPAAARVLDGPTGNAVLDSGESTDLAVVLRNLGGYASNVTGDLVPIGQHATCHPCWPPGLPLWSGRARSACRPISTSPCPR